MKVFIKKLIRTAPSDSAIVDYIKSMLTNKDEISILDIGGGFGDNFFHIEKALGSLSKRISYLVVDNKVQCDLGVKFYGNNRKISFTTTLPQNKFDLIIIIGTIQYIENWKEFIFDVTKISSNSIFISRTPINMNGPTFITIQSICPAYGPATLKKIGESNLNVINETELHNTFEQNGFLVDKSKFIQDYSENFKGLPTKYRDIKYIDKYFVKSN